MKRIGIITLFLVGLTALVVGNRLRRRRNAARYTVGIIQTASHPALDAVREGFTQELHDTLGNDVAFVTYNAQGSIAQAHAAAQQLHADGTVQALFAIATPAALAAGTVEKEKPVIIAAVTDPHALGLMQATNICGTQDMIDVAAEIEMLTQLIPTAKTVGLLYTSGETNSLVTAEIMRKELEKRGLTAFDFAVSNEADMPAMAELAARKVDVILAPTDNTVASSIALVASIASNKNKPLIVSDNMLVASGALAARGIDYNEHGKHAARIALQVLVEHKKPSELSIEQEKNGAIFVNRNTLHALGLNVPESLKSDTLLIPERI